MNGEKKSHTKGLYTPPLNGNAWLLFLLPAKSPSTPALNVAQYKCVQLLYCM